MSWHHEIGPTDVVTPRKTGRWTEDEARAEFRKFRFSANGGEPFCPHCQSVAVLTYRVRRLYRCKSCFKQFSDTSGTPFARMRIGFSDIMVLIAEFAWNKRGVSALSVSELLGRQYKTVLLWFHKIRQEIATRAEGLTLAREAEADAMFVGGHIRPKNVAKERKDLRRYPWRAEDRSFAIVAVRERGGAMRTFIGKTEAAPMKALRGAIERGTLVNTDKGSHWGPALRDKVRLRQVNHTQAFYTPEACTNGVESAFALIREMEVTYSHIAQNYLDLYAAEGAWRVAINKLPRGSGFGDIMRLMTRKALSPLTGYFQGRKRGCPVHMQDGSVESWKPDFRGRRTSRAGDVPTDYPLPQRRPLKKFWKEQVTLLDVRAFLEDAKVAPNQPGVYVIFLRKGRELIQGPGAQAALDNLWSVEDYDHIYTGETYAVRSRLLEHLVGTGEGENLRTTLRAVRQGLGLDPLLSEESLTEFLSQHGKVGFLACPYPGDVETAILEATASPLNIKRPAPGDYVRFLRSRLADYRASQSERS